MRSLLALFLGLGAACAASCKAHVHGREPGRELVSIQLTSGLT
jgi:hypothetical protein